MSTAEDRLATLGLRLPAPPAPVARVVEPRLDRYEIHLHATQEQRRLMQLEEDQ